MLTLNVNTDNDPKRAFVNGLQRQTPGAPIISIGVQATNFIRDHADLEHTTVQLKVSTRRGAGVQHLKYVKTDEAPWGAFKEYAHFYKHGTVTEIALCKSIFNRIMKTKIPPKHLYIKFVQTPKVG